MAYQDYSDQFNAGPLGLGNDQLPAYLAQAMQEYQTGYPDKSGLPSYLSNAMSNASNNPQPVSTPTPISDAMAGPQSMVTPLSQAMQGGPMSPAAPLGPVGPSIQTIFQRQAADPSMSLNNGLIAAGSAMLGADNLQKGMGAAGQAFNGAFDQTLNQQRDLNTPKAMPLADGAFSMVQLPGQSPQVVPNAQVANFMLGRTMLQNQMALNKEVALQNLRSQAQQAQNDRAQAATYGPKLQQTNQAIATVQRALEVAQQQAAQRNAWTSQWAGAFPGVANFFGTESAQGNNVIQNALVDTQLAQDAQKSGVVTDQQAKMLGADVPGISADRETVLIPFLQRRLEALQRYQSYQQSQVDKGNPAPPTGFATQGTSNVFPGPGGVLSRGGSAGPIRGNGMSYVQ
ncbi:hypothetical protein [Burkholderia sp. Ac-20353]|uniref:hypothetical protein n=1 Tax=Burkholderia sp. Ac-20353 TaxID=2703894 RepID=UPI00197C8850|nr:hypothetical protein [Burkholderia sp. Ac-20353]MBN3791863.1 hypothetical protein [Burkholderia sp. Ac-20353]